MDLYQVIEIMALVTKVATPNNLYIGVYLGHYMQRALIFDMNYHLVDLYQIY